MKKDAESPPSPPRVLAGLDVLAAEGFRRLRGARVGAIVNHTTVDWRMHHLADLLHEAEGVTLAALFGPEHGVRGDAQDMEGVGEAVDLRTGVPVFSLYGDSAASLVLPADALEGLDALIFDVQDVGSRYYTFAATMLYAMRAASGSGVRFLVLDRPNPIGGESIEGPSIAPGHESFVGAYPMPIRHGMTVGELARMFRGELKLDLDLEVVPCVGWERGMHWGDTGRFWVAPSPNMPATATALVYPGGCLIEGTNLSEGRGTTQPFELWGAPWLDGHALRAAAERHDLPGVVLRPAGFRPTFHKHAKRGCQGVQPHVTDPSAFRPLWTYTVLLALARAQDPGRFAWRTEAYEFVSDPIAIDLLYGSPRERLAIESGDIDGLPEIWAQDEAAFRERRAPYLLT